LGKLAFIISEFIRKTKESVILIEGIEYLIIQNDFLSVLKILNGIGDLVVLSDSRLILTLNPYTLTEKEKALLERGFEVYRLESQG
jgi:two-component system cell cycle response regulator